jgi:hypothetical protein
MEAEIGKCLGSDDGELPNEVVRRFLSAFVHRAASRDRLHIFTTNYDRLLEHACDDLGVHMVDRFVGSLAPRFRSSRLELDLHYSPPGLRGEPRYLEGVVRLSKLHGSLDWKFRSNGSVERFALPLGAPVPSPDANLVVYPNDTKDIETAQYPYTDLFRDFAAAMCRPNHVLVTYGYGFRDSHINRVIADMLTIPSTHLVIISFDDPDGTITGFVDEFGLQAQTTAIIGPEVASLDEITKLLPAPAHERVQSKMTRLVEQRSPVATATQNATTQASS